MTKQTINIGTADKGDGDPLRTAFTKVNANFTELYEALGLTDNNLNLGSFEFTDNTITTTDSTNIIIDQAVVMTSELEVGGDIVPNVANQHTLGTPEKPFKSLYVSNQTIYLDGVPLAIDEVGNLTVNNVPVNSVGSADWSAITNKPTFSDAATSGSWEDITGKPSILTGDDVIGFVTSETITEEFPGGTASQTTSYQNQIIVDTTDSIRIANVLSQTVNDGVTTATDSTGSTIDVDGTGAYIKRYVEPDGPNNSSYFQFSTTNSGAIIEGVNEDLAGNTYGRVTVTQGVVVINTAAGGIDKEWLFDSDGNLTLPQGGDILDSNGDSVLGGEAGPVQPYLELTNEPLIVQPVTLGTPVTVTVPNSGNNGQVQFIITAGPTIDINDVTILSPGTGYVVGQRYRIWYYDAGGSNTDSNIIFTVASVGEAGELLSVTDFAFAGGLADNSAGTYTSYFELQAWVFDEIGTGLTLARDGNQGIYNADLEPEYDNNSYLSPLGTEWNSDGWGDLTEIGLRTYTTWRQSLNNQVGNEIVASELVMHDTVNDKYYKFDFTNWGGSNGGYSYTRTEVTDPNYFRKPHNAESADIVIEDDPEGTGIVIGRTDSTGIYNLAQEAGFVADSPVGTTWNADGWDDLSDIATRTYQVFDLAADGYNNVLGKKFVMYVASIQKYYAIQFYEWATNGDNNFAYVRYEIDQTKLVEGITFADGTILKSAEGVGRVKSTAAGNRRIEEVTGYNQVSVTSKVTNNYVGSISQTSNGYELRIARTIELDAVLQPIFNGTVNATFTLSFDNAVYREVWLSSIQETEYWFYYQVDFGQTTPQTEGDTVYLEVITGADPVVWWDKADLPGGSQYFRGAVIDYHAYTGESTIIGSIHIIDDDGEEHISHQEVQSGSTDGENDDLWLVTTEGQIRYRRIDGESKTLKIHWTAKVFYGSELYD